MQSPTRCELGWWADRVEGMTADVTLDAERDAFEWLPLGAAASRCLPARVGECLLRAAAWLDAGGELA